MEGLLGRVYEWIASVPTLRLEQAYQFDIRNLFVIEPHTDVVVGPPGDQQPWMNDTDDSQLLMFFQTYGKNEGINVTRGQYTYHRDPVPIKDIRNADGSMLLPIATAFIMLLKAHEHSVATNCDPTPPSSALFKKILRDSKGEPRTVRECYPNMTNDCEGAGREATIRQGADAEEAVSAIAEVVPRPQQCVHPQPSRARGVDLAGGRRGEC